MADRVLVNDIDGGDQSEVTRLAALELGIAMRSRLNFTASASTSSPLWNVTPLRI